MSRALLDAMVPAWLTMDVYAFRAAIRAHPRHAVALRDAYDAAKAAPPPVPAPAPGPTGPLHLSPKPTRRGPGVLTPTPRKG